MIAVEQGVCQSGTDGSLPGFQRFDDIKQAF
jgi:hypothetical protein